MQTWFLLWQRGRFKSLTIANYIVSISYELQKKCLHLDTEGMNNILFAYECSEKQTVFIGTTEEIVPLKTLDIVLCGNISKPEQMKPKQSKIHFCHSGQGVKESTLGWTFNP